MLYEKNRISQLSLVFFILLFSCSQVSGQKIIPVKKGFSLAESFSRQDTALEIRKRNATASEPDTNFTWEKYASFLKKISDTSKYIVLPLNEFKKTSNPGKIVIGLRHDVDNDLNIAVSFSETEYKLGFRSTYFILHTAPYYLANPGVMSEHSDKILPVLRMMQNERKFEIGWHNDLVTLQAVYNIDPATYLHNELIWLRTNGINVTGTASHGSNFCYVYKYLNYYFFEECTWPIVGQFVNNLTLPLNGVSVPMKKGKLADFNLDYEAYFLNYNKAFSDASITNGIRWNIGMLNLNALSPGDRVVILLHPIHWHKASVAASIEAFRITGQKSSTIDYTKNEISVEMPSGVGLNNLIASFILSPGAIAKVSGSQQVSGSTTNNFYSPITYEIYAENREVHKQWKVNVHNTVTDNEANFISFSIPEMIGPAIIDTLNNIIRIDIAPEEKISSVAASFTLSQDAHAFVGSTEQISDLTFNNFTAPVEYEVVSKDGSRIKHWKVIVRQQVLHTEDKGSNSHISVYPNPSKGIIYMEFRNIVTSPTYVEIYNASGKKVYSQLVAQIGDFSVTADLSSLDPGFYILRFSKFEKPLKIVILD